jgi:hypothetical protein
VGADVGEDGAAEGSTVGPDEGLKVGSGVGWPGMYVGAVVGGRVGQRVGWNVGGAIIIGAEIVTSVTLALAIAVAFSDAAAACSNALKVDEALSPVTCTVVTIVAAAEYVEAKTMRFLELTRELPEALAAAREDDDAVKITEANLTELLCTCITSAVAITKASDDPGNTGSASPPKPTTEEKEMRGTDCNVGANDGATIGTLDGKSVGR